jgi:hypothetical protein
MAPVGESPFLSETGFDQNVDLVLRLRRFAMPDLADEDSGPHSQVNRGSDEYRPLRADPNLGIHPFHDLDARRWTSRHYRIDDFHPAVDGSRSLERF